MVFGVFIKLFKLIIDVSLEIWMEGNMILGGFEKKIILWYLLVRILEEFNFVLEVLVYNV